MTTGPAPREATHQRLSAVTAVRVVAGREITVKLRDKAFIGSTVFMLLLVTAATVLPVLLGQRIPSVRVAVQGAAAEEVIDLAADLGRRAQEADDAASPQVAMLGVGGLPGADITSVDVEPGVEIERLLRDEDVSAALVGDSLADLTIIGLQSVSSELEVLVRAAAGDLAVARTASAAGLTAEEVTALTQPASLTVDLLEGRPAGSMPPQFLVVIFAFLFYISVLTFGMSIAQSVVEEKQSRVVELLVAAMPIRWLLAGKVVGNTVMALGQVVVVVGAGILGAALAGQSELIRQVIGVSGWFVGFFLLGFVMLACLWAVAGSLASRVEDLNSTTVVMQVLVIVPFFAAIFAMEPGPVQEVLSYIPFTAPLMMPARIVLGTVDAWEPYVAAGAVLLTAAVFVALGVKLYAGSVLHTSGRLKVAQAWRGVV